MTCGCVRTEWYGGLGRAGPTGVSDTRTRTTTATGRSMPNNRYKPRRFGDAARRTRPRWIWRPKRIRRSPGIAWADVHATRDGRKSGWGAQLLSAVTTGASVVGGGGYVSFLIRSRCCGFLRPERATHVTSISITCNRRTPRGATGARHGDRLLRYLVAGDHRP